MRNDDLQAKIRTAFDHAAPDVLDSVLSDIASGNSDTKPILVMGGQNTMKNTIRNLTAIAAAAVLVIGGGAGLAVYNNNYRVASTISLDVNPSVEITGKTAIPEFQRWLEKMGFMENGKLTAKAGDGSTLLF